MTREFQKQRFFIELVLYKTISIRIISTVLRIRPICIIEVRLYELNMDVW